MTGGTTDCSFFYLHPDYCSRSAGVWAGLLACIVHVNISKSEFVLLWLSVSRFFINLSYEFYITCRNGQALASIERGKADLDKMTVIINYYYLMLVYYFNVNLSGK